MMEDRHSCPIVERAARAAKQGNLGSISKCRRSLSVMERRCVHRYHRENPLGVRKPAAKRHRRNSRLIQSGNLRNLHAQAQQGSRNDIGVVGTTEFQRPESAPKSRVRGARDFYYRSRCRRLCEQPSGRSGARSGLLYRDRWMECCAVPDSSKARNLRAARNMGAANFQATTQWMLLSQVMIPTPFSQRSNA